MIIYMDIFFIQNFIVNLFLLYITSQTLKINIKIKNNIFAAVFGAIYAVLTICTSFKFLFYIPVKLLIAISMVLISFNKKDFLFNTKAVIMFILYSILLGGMCIFIEFNKSSSIDLSFKGFSYKSLICSLMAIYIVIHRMVIHIRDRKKIDQLIYDVEIIDDNFEEKVKAFFDTGNELREPATNLPVMIVERSLFHNLNIEDKDKFIIPYRVVNGFSAKLEGFKPKMIKIYKDNEVESCQVIIALCENKLSQLNDYNALLSRGIF
ncbi:sigma-E processing peptidase SpoIIGA [Clostridium sp. MB40-C1]|uniref:sigma-E processing peptidase SpoIIGA n=1 Tax=Clostridium sp. MB40-C1 TaxID=3070996 RepID=UPI0027DF9987|nr:sigma-E processing peptidase SpoIIGA [Clostridium sp. MB40-C1]WMJ82122.1 sigma-E processing peptidase SpoIIGA [Clostridium sp. MB40-C1]